MYYKQDLGSKQQSTETTVNVAMKTMSGSEKKRKTKQRHGLAVSPTETNRIIDAWRLRY